MRESQAIALKQHFNAHKFKFSKALEHKFRLNPRQPIYFVFQEAAIGVDLWKWQEKR
jgi:hypothetical protein